MIRTICPKCKADLESLPEMAGKEDQCPDCGQTFVVPCVQPWRTRLKTWCKAHEAPLAFGMIFALLLPLVGHWVYGMYQQRQRRAAFRPAFARYQRLYEENEGSPISKETGTFWLPDSYGGRFAFFYYCAGAEGIKPSLELINYEEGHELLARSPEETEVIGVIWGPHEWSLIPTQGELTLLHLPTGKIMARMYVEGRRKTRWDPMLPGTSGRPSGPGENPVFRTSTHVERIDADHLAELVLPLVKWDERQAVN